MSKPSYVKVKKYFIQEKKKPIKLIGSVKESLQFERL